MSKAKKNDIIVVVKSHSATTVKMKTTRYDTYHLAQVTKATRLGIVQQCRPIGGDLIEVETDPAVRVLTIEDADKQALARKLADLLKANPAKNDYSKPELIRDAILTTTP